MDKNRKILYIIITFIIIIGVSSGILLFYMKSHASINVDATVTRLGDGYIVVEDDNNKEYSIKTVDDYNIGDKISFKMKDVKKNTYPLEGVIEELNIVSRNVDFYIEDDITEDEKNVYKDNNIITENNNNNSTDTSNNTNNSIINTTTTEKDIITYFEDININLDNYSNNKELGQNIKDRFVNIVDFLFYGGTIKGKTFNELSDKTKLKVLEISLFIDKKIDKHFPGYKEEISSKGNKIYTDLKSKIASKYLDITTDICNNNEELCSEAKEGFSNLKRSFSLTWEVIKNASSEGISKLKNWYEIWKES